MIIDTVMNFPQPLKRGDKVALISPSSPATAAEINASLMTIQAMGFCPVPQESLNQQYGGFMSGSGAFRGEEINRLFADKSIQGIFCVRGGYSASHVLPYLDYQLIRNNPKLFIGYSDVTAYHIVFNQICNLITFHGPMGKADMIVDFDKVTQKSFWQALQFENNYQLENSQPIEVLFTGKAKGRLVGGNLSLIVAGIGTAYQINTQEKILFIEDIGESVARIDRMMQQLKYSGLLSQLNGVILGDFNNCTNSYCEKYQVIDVMRDSLAEFSIPVLYNIAAGHCKPNLTLPLGAVCELDGTSKTISFYRY